MLSPSSRRAWIEISFGLHILLSGFVALLAEGVDRNQFIISNGQSKKVALLAEGVDRNWHRALRCAVLRSSPSSRRAWIEIFNEMHKTKMRYVALLAEGVDRNYEIRELDKNGETSPSSRRAWIEISHGNTGCPRSAVSPSSRRAWIEITRRRVCSTSRPVALLAEGVDRNFDDVDCDCD